MDGYTRIIAAPRVITATVVGLDTRRQTIADGSNPPTDHKVGSSRHQKHPLPALSHQPARGDDPLQRWQYVEQEVAAGGGRVEHVGEDSREVEIAG